jgi:hypothetical protein
MMTLDKYIDSYQNKKELINVGVGRIISELFYDNTYRQNNHNGTRGYILHSKLGFVNDQVFCRYIETDKYYVRLCGTPDRIVYEDGILYVDELKTTSSRNIDFARTVGEYQLQFYMFLTGIHNGRVYVYSTIEKKLYEFPVKYDETLVLRTLEDYLKLYEAKLKFRKNH